jgi:hypothetical protein
MSPVFRIRVWVTLICQEMDSGERQTADGKIPEETLLDAPSAEEQGWAETDVFRCGRCKLIFLSMILRVVQWSLTFHRRRPVTAWFKLVTLMSLSA